jgi:hypothetical protein
MARSTFFGPDYERILREQARSIRADRQAERLAVLAGSPLSGRYLWERSDPEADARAARSFGFSLSEMRRFTSSRDASSVAPRLSSPTTSKAAAGDDMEGLKYIDIHSHNFCADRADIVRTFGGAVDSSTIRRIDWLYNAATASNVRYLVLSGMASDGADGPILDDVTAYAFRRYPDFFIPFLRAFPHSPGLWKEAPITKFDSAYVGERLGEGKDAGGVGFQGVGELIVHGHGTDIEDDHAIAGIFAKAAEYDSPVLVHWEFGNVSEGSWAAADNFEQLNRVLKEVETASPTVIVAHCAAGPSTMDAVALVAYTTCMNKLLSTYSNVFFDLAGMQKNGEQKLYSLDRLTGSYRLTPLGGLIAGWMQYSGDGITYPTRFLFGIDTENRTEDETEGWISSIGNYEIFMDVAEDEGYDLSTLDVRTMFRYNNAATILGLPLV